MTSRRSWADIEDEANLDFDPRATAEYQKAIWGPELGALLRTARARTKTPQGTPMSQTALAQEMNTSQPNVARLESGSALPTVETLAWVAEALGKRIS